jgi:hypothetical protein
MDDRSVALQFVIAVLLLGSFGGGYAVGRGSVPARPAAVASVADRYELRESGVVGLLVRLDKQTGETTPISAIPAR